MKRLLEPITGIVLSYAAWEAWTDLLVSLIVAFLGGALAYLGKWLAALILQQFAKNKNKSMSNGPEDPIL